VTAQFGASLADDSRVVIYYCNMLIVQATGVIGLKWMIFHC